MLGFVFWADRFFCRFLLAVVFCLFASSSLLYTFNVLLGTSWFFFFLSIYCFLLIKKKTGLGKVD